MDTTEYTYNERQVAARLGLSLRQLWRLASIYNVGQPPDRADLAWTFTDAHIEILRRAISDRRARSQSMVDMLAVRDHIADEWAIEDAAAAALAEYVCGQLACSWPHSRECVASVLYDRVHEDTIVDLLLAAEED